MKLFVFFFFITIAVNSNILAEKPEKVMIGASPVNADASSETKNLLSYFYSISGKYTLTGQHNFLGRMSKYTDSIYHLTGMYPAIWGSDFGFSDSTHDIDNIKYRSLLIAEVEKQHHRGSIITFTYHQANPSMGEPCRFEGGVESKLTNGQWNDVLTPGTSLNNEWCKQMDIIAFYLKKFRDDHIPILFRPYHEMNGGWFWWGRHQGENGYKALWIQLFKYFTIHHQLNNLIWVWSPDKPSNGLKEYYPGDEYVDIVACDIYPEKDTSVVYRQEWYNDLLEITKNRPLAIGECGTLVNDEILIAQPRWVWFMSWCEQVFKRNSPEEINKIYHSDRFITLDKLPKFLKDN